MHEHGRFYDYIKSKVSSQSNNSASTSDHGYAPQTLSYQLFLKQSKPDEAFDLVQALDAFRPASIDPERVFFYGRVAKNYLQNRLSSYNQQKYV